MILCAIVCSEVPLSRVCVLTVAHLGPHRRITFGFPVTKMARDLAWSELTRDLLSVLPWLTFATPCLPYPTAYPTAGRRARLVPPHPARTLTAGLLWGPGVHRLPTFQRGGSDRQTNCFQPVPVCCSTYLIVSGRSGCPPVIGPFWCW